MEMVIGGNKVVSSSGKTIDVSNSYTQEVIDSVPAASKEDVQKSVFIADKGKKTWENTPLYKRVEIIHKFLANLADYRDALGALMSKETGKLLNDCKGEVDYVIDGFKGYIEIASHRLDEILPAENRPGAESDITLTYRVPIGIIACILPFNYPLALFVHKVAPAIVTGNVVIIKPPSESPLAITRLVQIMIESGIPGDVVQVVTGSGSEVGYELASNPLVDAVSLTGSVETGLRIAECAAKNLKRTFLELGGNDALIIFRDADIDKAVNIVFGGRIANAGQICAASKRVLVHNSIKKEFTERLVEAFKNIKYGDPMDPNTEMGCLVSVKAAEKVEEQVNLTISQGAKCLCGGMRDKSLFAPTVLADVTLDMDIATDMEVFGPVVPILGFDTIDEAINIANAQKYGLQHAIVTPDISLALKTAKRLDAGGVVINGPNSFRTHDIAFGGHKMSGMGVEGMSHTMDEMTLLKNFVLKDIYA